jgi:hypothetical protein
VLPDKELCLDEGMVLFKGRLAFEQYMPFKPTKWGLKVWVLTDAETGYILNFEIYCGSKGEKYENCLMERVVLQLTELYYGEACILTTSTLAVQ